MCIRDRLKDVYVYLSFFGSSYFAFNVLTRLLAFFSCPMSPFAVSIVVYGENTKEGKMFNKLLTSGRVYSAEPIDVRLSSMPFRKFLNTRSGG